MGSAWCSPHEILRNGLSAPPRPTIPNLIDMAYVLRAIGLGAKGTMIGRAFLYGLGAMGKAGVHLCLEIIAKKLSAEQVLPDLSERVRANPAGCL
jgi:FMN-dependent dehydrogenase